MKVGVVYALPSRQTNLTADVPEGATVQDVIDKSGILKQHPDIDLATQKVGVFGKLVKLDAKVEDGDRVEIYRALIVDPKTVKRKPKPEGEGDDE